MSNPRLENCTALLHELGLLSLLSEFSPFLAGTIPLDIDTPDSDVDLLCFLSSSLGLEIALDEIRPLAQDFRQKKYSLQNRQVILSNFSYKGEEFEVFAQDLPVADQMAFRHFKVEERLLEIGGEKLKSQVRELKGEGLNTEAAFCRALEIQGDPFQELYKLYGASREELGGYV